METTAETYEFEDFVDYCESTKAGENWVQAGRVLSCSDPYKWNGNVTYAETLGLARSGWADGTAQIEKIVTEESAQSTMTISRNTWEYGPMGIRPYVPLYLAGAPDCMMNFTRRPVQTKPVVTIAYYAACACTVDGPTYLRQGIALASLIDSIESNGISVELKAIYQTGKVIPVVGKKKPGWQSLLSLTVNLKAAGQPLDTDRLTLAVAHPAFFRRMVFRWVERTENYTDYSLGYGKCPLTPVFPAENAIIIPSLTERDNDKTLPEMIAKVQGIYQAAIANVTETP